MDSIERIIEPIIKNIERVYNEYEDDSSSVQILLVLNLDDGYYLIEHTNQTSLER